MSQNLMATSLYETLIVIGVTQLNTISQAEDHRVPVQNYPQLRKSYVIPAQSLSRARYGAGIQPYPRLPRVKPGHVLCVSIGSGFRRNDDCTPISLQALRRLIYPPITTRL